MLNGEEEVRILVVEDESLMRRILAVVLRKAGYQVLLAANGQEALEHFFQNCVDLVLLDIMLPDVDGYQLCQELRMYSRVPIFVLTALNGIDSRIKGLNAGADAVISKPYSPAVLLARIEAVLRRMDQGRRSRDGTEGIVTIGDITLDEAKFKVWVREVDTKLTKMEFRLLSFLMNHPDRPLDKTRLLEKVWHYSPNGAATSNTTVVEVTVSRLRRKIEQDPANPAHVITVEKGYMFNSGYS